MTASELAKLIGMTATVEVTFNSPPQPMATAQVEVRILDARDAYGRTDLLIEATDGKGKAWVSSDRVKVRGA